MLVSCLPIVTLAFGTALAHLLHVGESAPAGAGVPVPQGCT